MSARMGDAPHFWPDTRFRLEVFHCFPWRFYGRMECWGPDERTCCAETDSLHRKICHLNLGI